MVEDEDTFESRYLEQHAGGGHEPIKKDVYLGSRLRERGCSAGVWAEQNCTRMPHWSFLKASHHGHGRDGRERDDLSNNLRLPS